MIPYKGVTLGPYPQLLESISHPCPSPAARFHDLPSGLHRSGLPDLSTGKPRILAGIPVIWVDFHRRRPGKQLKLAPIV
jgi:hypothetical protein